MAAGVVAQDIATERAALDRAQRAARSAAERATRLESAASAASDEAAKIRASAAAVAARIQSAEADIDTAEARIAVVEQLRAGQRARLAEKQGPTVRLVAALQTMARKPPALALVQPGSIRDMVHVHAVFASVLPVVRARTADLRADVERGRQLRLAADAALAEERGAQNRLIAQRQQLAALEARKRAESSRFASGAMAEQDRAIAMGEEARDIGELMGRIEDADAIRARLESLPGPILRPAQPSAARALPSDTAVASTAIPAYRLPVVGQVVTGLGEVSDAGVRARGLTIATRAGAQVVAPTSGRIVFAGPFRGYGNIVVIDHGLGWTTLLTSLAALDVKVGDSVDPGAPVGRAGPDRPTVTVELRRRGTPVDIAKLAG
ncbi:murein hydrolase activator EnvC [Sphingomonas sp. SUN039]|uniref:murein hydrolase activator EnvC family protein n=1 Tax=Sphingomonas sp. SUN039 TaxID=2937787 RepID=UPI002164B76C|nr:peptidoglycan DD-metalloendopeptidase family protein [Sphingomonas sp. SUN039]UVO54935.1 peptidoglycan DD-metalloendopeptidase family protein [Sphingomonas sp. SUN039]